MVDAGLAVVEPDAGEGVGLLTRRTVTAMARTGNRIHGLRARVHLSNQAGGPQRRRPSTE